MHRHVAVWLDHHEAKIFHITADAPGRDELKVAHHLHHPGKTGGHAELHRKDAVDHPFFNQIAAHLAEATEILVLGPSTAKTEFSTFMKEHHKGIAAKIGAVEASDHPTDAQIVAHARKYFEAADRMQ